MTKVEMLILIIGCCIPLFSFFLVIKPKFKNIFKKKDCSKKVDVKKEEPKQEETKEPIVEIKPAIKEKSTREDLEENFYRSDYTDFARRKHDNIELPKRNYPKRDYELSGFDYNGPKMRTEKSIAEQIQDLSPELKALILAGVFNKRDIDNI